MKQMLAWSGLDCGVCLGPRAALDETQKAALKAALVDAGFEDLATHRD